jgi:hypothetical protein
MRRDSCILHLELATPAHDAASLLIAMLPVGRAAHQQASRVVARVGSGQGNDPPKKNHPTTHNHTPCSHSKRCTHTPTHIKPATPTQAQMSGDVGRVMMVLITDGRANVSLAKSNEDPAAMEPDAPKPTVEQLKVRGGVTRRRPVRRQGCLGAPRSAPREPRASSQESQAESQAPL